MAALFVRVKDWKPPKCPSKKDGLNKLWGTEAMEYYAALKQIEESLMCRQGNAPSDTFESGKQ